MKKLLVADDEDGIVRLITAMLDEADVAVIAAQDGNEALDKVREQRPDLVLSDVMMPGLDGRELCRIIKADRDLSGTPVVLMSALSKLDLGDGDEDAFLRKPFGMTALAEIFDRFLSDAS